MYLLLLTLHSWGRWVLLLGLLFGLLRAGRGWLSRRPFTPLDEQTRRTVPTLAHAQLLLGYLLYFQSPLVRGLPGRATQPEAGSSFLNWQHELLMTLAVVLLTLGSALATRQATDQAKLRTMTNWFAAALLLILVAIPWPFSPFASRPFFRL